MATRKGAPSETGGYCCNCASSVGDSAKRTPVAVHDADGQGGRPEIWCPRCFVLKRMHLEPERFNATYTAAVSCGFCGFESVCFGYVRGRVALCGHCTRPGAVPVNLSAADEEAIAKGIAETVEDAGAKVLRTK